MSTLIRFRGSYERANRTRLSAAADTVEITPRGALVPGAARDSASEHEWNADDIVRVELQNGFVLWTRADDLQREHGRPSIARDGGRTWEIDLRPRTATRDRGQRGWLGLGIKVLEFFGVDLKGKAAAALGSKLEEKRLGNKPGLYRATLDDRLQLTVVADPVLPAGNGPLLLFVHGTGSSTSGGFGQLWDAKNEVAAGGRRKLKELYGDRVYALEHRSLTESPIQNALDLAQRLPDNAELHLVTHSRGGLVGELLCLAERDRTRNAIDEETIKTLFGADRTLAESIGLGPLDSRQAKERDEAYEEDRKRLLALVEVLDRKSIRVRRFVRVACPAAGTTLASGRLDRWLSVLDAVTGSGLVGDAVDFLLAVVKERTDPRTLPGLEAMMPGSALTRFLRSPDLIVSSDLSVIAGDVEGDSLWSQIKLLATDWFYGSDHDLVVNTGSMYGGIRRTEKAARFVFDQGEQVTHSAYFRNERSVRWLIAGLLRADNTDGGYQPIESARYEEPRSRAALRRSRSVTTPRPLAVVLPGTMGSALEADGDRVWLHYFNLLRGRLEDLRMGRREVRPVDLLDDFYGPLIEYLARSHRVELFPYDWRLSVREAAKRLADKLEAWLPDAERSRQPVHLVAHSMGGLVVRAMIADPQRGNLLWRRIVAIPNSRLMMLGTPNLGSHEAMRWLTGSNATLAKLSLLDFKRGSDDIIDIVRRFPGLLELLPFGNGATEFGQAGFWTDLKRTLGSRWRTAEENELSQARETWALLRSAPPEPQHMVYVAGCQPATVTGYALGDFDQPHLRGRKRLEYAATAEGDGTVTWESGRLRDVPTWYVEDTAHDALCAQTRALPAYIELLTKGKTQRLPSAPPRNRSGAEEVGLFALPQVPPTDDMPDERSTLRLGFGSPLGPQQTAGVAAPTIKVSVCHGDLAYARHPVMVGHYMGDGIVSAEAALDKRLDGVLSRRLALGLYPDRIGTHALFFDPKGDRKPAGAVVIGLGQVGDLSPGLLERSVRDALLDYALKVAEWPDERFGPAKGVRSAKLSCLLVGSGAGGIPVRDSIDAILRGGVAANTRLVDSGLDGRVLIAEIELLELFEHVAIEAVDALDAALRDGELAVAIDCPPEARVVQSCPGRMRRVRVDAEDDWWQRLEIVEDEAGDRLRFVASTDRARAEETLATGQLQLAQSFVAQASQSTTASSETAKTLFEMLLPNRLRELAPKQGNMVLLVDALSARFPWELLEDRWSQQNRPLAVANGMVRQLRTPRFREHPAHAIDANAFVVGNPDLSGWEDRFSDLPGARDEAQRVAALLGACGYSVLDSIDRRVPDILDGLHKKPWRILHLAGHGEHDFPVSEEEWDARKACGLCGQDMKRDKRTLSGMVIGRNAFLTPGDVAQMRWVPELVFVNCCHLGKTRSDRATARGPLAANLAVQFIEMGVKAVVAAGWAVDDAAASAFAESFYGHLLKNDYSFGEAVQAAREETWMRFPSVNTWGAYQCYGDPSFRLRGQGLSPPRPPRSLRAPVELVAELENYAESIKVESRERNEDEETLARLRRGIEQRLAGVPSAHREAWLKRADVAAAIGFAWGETGAFHEALRWLDIAVAADQGDCPVRAVEQSANFRARLAYQEWAELREQPGADLKTYRGDIAERIEASIREIDSLCERAPTPERLNVLGSAYKRLAAVQAGAAAQEPRFNALKNMADAYRRAWKLGEESDAYPFNNWAVAILLAAPLDPAGEPVPPELESECRRVLDTAKRRDEQKPDLWNATALGDGGLVLMLLPGRSRSRKNEIEGIVEAYRTALARGASPRQLDSIRQHLDFLIDLWPAGPQRTALRSVREAI
ncbi:MAG: DUF7379 domain-containing protein [Panacagrimonas sp.]